MDFQPTLPASWRDIPTLAGRHVRLEPLAPAHADELRAALAGDELAELWFTNVPRASHVDAWLEAALALHASGSVVPFAVRDAEGGLVGSTRLYALEPDVPRLGIGYTWYVPHAQRTAVNTETKQLLLQHAFETLGCIAVMFETSTHNQASRQAISRLGARQDGILRNHRRHADGSPRDTVVFSIIDSEWPTVKQHLQSRLAFWQQQTGTA